MKVISQKPETIQVTYSDGKQDILNNVLEVEYIDCKQDEIYIDCSTTSAPLEIINQILSTQGYIKVKLWNGVVLTAISYVYDYVYDDLIFDNGTQLSKMGVPRVNPTRVGYAVYGYWQP